jgi:hypothetical protein
MVIRDEADILAESLQHLLTWVDGLYVLDLGSTDGSWEIVNDLAKSDERIVPYLSSPIVYNDALRSILFHVYRNRFKKGDWICKVDADEFYDVVPPIFVKESLASYETSVWLQWYFFRLTTQEVSGYESGRVDLVSDRKTSILERRRFYKITEHSEPRMFRYRPSMKWSERAAFPFNAGLVAKARIPIRHYPHRDPAQMAERYRLRAAMMRLDPNATGQHWNIDDWRQDVITVTTDGGSLESGRLGLSSVPGHTSGELYELKPGQNLPTVQNPTHVSKPLRRVSQRIAHSFMLGVLDLLRPPYNPAYSPTPIPESVTRLLGAPISQKEQ